MMGTGQADPRRTLLALRFALIAAAAVVAAAGVLVVFSSGSSTGQAPADQVWIAASSAGPNATVTVAVTGRSASTRDLQLGADIHDTFIVDSGATITVTVAAHTQGGTVKEATRTMCAIGDSNTDDTLVVQNGYGRGTIVCRWTRP